MPQKGHYTACVAVLFERAPHIDEVVRALRSFDVVGRSGETDPEAWMFGGPSVAIAYRPEVNGLVVVDVVDRPWPDAMGNPKDDRQLFGAWMMGHLGPFTFPDALSRAASQSWTWPDGKTVPENHAAFVRIRAGYAFGEDTEEKSLLPDGYDATDELRFVTNVAAAVLDVSGAICCFNPNGETLRDASALADALQYAEAEGIPPLDAWCNVRVAPGGESWLVMDTIGNQQLDIPDIELDMAREKGYDLTQVDGFLRSITEYLLEKGDVIADGDTMDGVGTTWTFVKRKTGILMPPRPTLRAFPQDGTTPPAELMNERQE